MAHFFFCRIYGISVRKVCYFRVGNPSGYVIHEEPETFLQDIMIAVGPFVINTVAGGLVALPGALAIMKKRIDGPIEYLLLWLGFSIAIHAFPSAGDAASAWRGLWARRMSFAARLVGVTIVGLVYLGSLGTTVRLNWAYAVAVVLLFPKLLIWAVATSNTLAK